MSTRSGRSRQSFDRLGGCQDCVNCSNQGESWGKCLNIKFWYVSRIDAVATRVDISDRRFVCPLQSSSPFQGCVRVWNCVFERFSGICVVSMWECWVWSEGLLWFLVVLGFYDTVCMDKIKLISHYKKFCRLSCQLSLPGLQRASSRFI